MDAPLAPKLCAGVLGRALLQGVLPPDVIPELCKPIEGGEVRRALVAPALQYVKVGRTPSPLCPDGLQMQSAWPSLYCGEFLDMPGVPLCCGLHCGS